MEKIIKIGKTEVKLNNNVTWTMEYRDQFGKDILPSLMPFMGSLIEGLSGVILESNGQEVTMSDLAEAVHGNSIDMLLPLYQADFVDVVVNVTWAMAKAADEDIDPPKKWLKQFDTFPLDIVVPAVYELIMKGFTSSKNLRRLKSLGKTIKNLQPSRSTTSSSQELKEA